jgi:Na+/H+ antiporter NhaD/arsenite permease-like protein
MARMEGLDLLAAAVVVRVVPQVQGITHPAQLAEQRLRVAVPAVMRRLVLVVIRVVVVPVVQVGPEVRAALGASLLLMMLMITRHQVHQVLAVRRHRHRNLR